LCCRVATAQQFAPGAMTHFSLQPDKMYFFDNDGNRL